MVFVFPCLVLLCHAVRTMDTDTAFPVSILNVKEEALDSWAKFTDIGSFQEAFEKKAKSLPEALFKANHLPNTCGIMFKFISKSFVGWEIKCAVPTSQQAYIACVDGFITFKDDETVCLDLANLYGKASSEFCPAGKASLAALDELAGLVPSQRKSIELYDMSTYDVLFKNVDRTPMTMTSLFFDVFLSPGFSSPSQAPTLGYYGKYGYKHKPESVVELTKAVEIFFKITVTDVQGLLDSNQINQETRAKVKKAIKRNTEYVGLVKNLFRKAIKLSERKERLESRKAGNFVRLVKQLYSKAIKLSERKEPRENKELEQTVDDIACFIDFLKEVQVGEIKWAFDQLNRGSLMTKIIQE